MSGVHLAESVPGGGGRSSQAGGTAMARATDELSVFEGVRPTRSGDLALESQGMAPIPEDNRYGGVHPMFTVWFTPNMELSRGFTGTLAVLFCPRFPLGPLALI